MSHCLFISTALTKILLQSVLVRFGSYCNGSHLNRALLLLAFMEAHNQMYC